MKRNKKSKTIKKKTTQIEQPKINVVKCDTFPPELLGSNRNKRRELNITTLVPSAVFAARNFLDASEAAQWVQFSEEIGFEQINSLQTREFAHRQCGRIAKNDWEMADRLYQRMRPMVEKIERHMVIVSGHDGTYAPVSCNGNLRLYKYEKNMSFGRHFDGSTRINHGKYKGGNTEITVLVYLSSCRGGATRFHLPSSKGRGGKKNKRKTDSNIVDDNDSGITFVPEAGSILMHMHGDRCLEHEADPVLDGIKYVLRTDIVYNNK
uniref:Fe2OG dioxygenase domain-containing protein n=1 Tax=Proboscia inermis TaxID=420281 RepID=A0A7S0C7X9_9STRA|mmetsp:Transcript_40452/g.47335  ORF Transcript_40452/g.47335 Transcript_40452/m.47335 type:complete len:265 (-) Transcript_40452:31-825(-)